MEVAFWKKSFFQSATNDFTFRPGLNFTAFLSGIGIYFPGDLGFLPTLAFLSTTSKTPKFLSSKRFPFSKLELTSSKKSSRTSFKFLGSSRFFCAMFWMINFFVMVFIFSLLLGGFCG